MAPHQPYGILQGISSNVRHERYSLSNSEVLLGRGSACQIQLKDPKVSRQHARVRFVQGVVTIEDLNSAHGTLVNGVRVTALQLRGGEEITIGDSRFRFEPAYLAAPTPQPVAPAPAPQPVTPVPVPQPQAAQAPQPAIAQIPETPGSRRWLLFLAGLVIPFILGVIGVAALFVLGFFDEPEAPPIVREAEPSSLEAAAEQEDTETTVAIPYTLRPYDQATDSDLPVQSSLAVYADDPEASEYLYAVPLSVGQEVVLDYFYCGTSEEILDEISGSIDITFEIDGVLISEETLATDRMVRETRACNISRAVFMGMAPGEHILVQTMRVEEQINDGWETWGPEELVSSILIRVEGDAAIRPENPDATVAASQTAEPTLDALPPVEPTVAALQPTERTVTLHVGDARMFSAPPEIIAYANTQTSPAPPEITLEESCGQDCWRYYEWLGIRGPNQWIEASATIPTTAIGVQFWGDDNDGFARVLLDGEEVWSGDTRGEDNQWPGGAFVRYLEISGLAEASHSIVVEATGEGGAITLYYFGIGAVIP